MKNTHFFLKFKLKAPELFFTYQTTIRCDVRFSQFMPSFIPFLALYFIKQLLCLLIKICLQKLSRNKALYSANQFILSSRSQSLNQSARKVVFTDLKNYSNRTIVAKLIWHLRLFDLYLMLILVHAGSCTKFFGSRYTTLSTCYKIRC